MRTSKDLAEEKQLNMPETIASNGYALSTTMKTLKEEKRELNASKTIDPISCA